MKMLGKIYVIKSNETDKVYIGSTIQSLSDRLRKHKRDYKCWLRDNNHYVSSFEIVKFDDAFIELLEEVDVETIKELHKIEGDYITKMDCVNKRIAGRDMKQYYQDNIEELKEQKRRYYNDNKEQLLEQKKRYYKDNKYKIKERNKEKINCVCGSVISKSNIAIHRKSLKHKEHIEIKIERNII